LLCSQVLFLLSTNTSQAQPAHLPCMLVCQPPDQLDAANCACKPPMPRQPKPCALVCLDPDETLDANECRCIKR
jgi:hypothetical protein